MEVIRLQSLTILIAIGMSDAFSGPGCKCINNQSEIRMKKDRKEIASSEPIGIVISRGDKTEPTPVFSAYIWGPVPDDTQDTATRAA
jgi:hypothetical protein